MIITDNDTILAISGSLKREYRNKNISSDLNTKIFRREEMLERHKKELYLVDDKTLEVTYAISPIVVDGDAIGTVLIIGVNDSVDEIDYKVAHIASMFIKGHLEQYCKNW